MDELDLFYEYRETEGLRPKTINWYRRHVDDFVGTMNIDSLDDWTPQNIARFLSIKRQTCNPTTLKMYWRVLTYVSRWLYLQKYLSEDPTPRIPRPRYTYEQKEGFSVDEVKAMLKVGERSYRPLFTRALILVLYDTGIRSGELCSLTLEHSHLTAFELVVRGKKQGSGSCRPGRRPCVRYRGTSDGSGRRRAGRRRCLSPATDTP